MIRYLTVSLMLSVLSITGCDSRPVIGKENLPFTVAGVTLSMDRDQVRTLGRLGTCRQENERLVSCTYRPESERIIFMGENVEWITYEFMDDNPKISLIKVATRGAMISDLSFRLNWKMEGRCLDDDAANSISKFSGDARDAVDRINEMQLRRYSGFACISEDGHYVSGSAHISGAGNKYVSLVEMASKNSYAVDAMNRVIAIRNEIEAKNKRVNTAQGS